MKRVVAVVGVAFAMWTMRADIAIDSSFPGGNVKVLKVDEAKGIVQVAPDLRDTKGNWFHFAFNVRGAAGRTIHFQFPKEGDYLSTLGPAISRDGGLTWNWLRPDGTRHEPVNAFDYTFGPTEGSVRFAMSIPYTQANWEAFCAQWKGRPEVKFGVLCKSESGARDVDCVRIPCRGKSDWLFVFTARHHACETTGNPPMEGAFAEILSGSPEGEWVREHADCLFVPFMDKDGVEAGDQGKNRAPYDHNRDYLKGRYASVRALKDCILQESKSRQIVFLDLHSPHVRGFPHSPEQEHVFTFGCRDPRLNANWEAFRKHWKDLQQHGKLVYDGTYDIHGGKGYAVVMEKQWAAGFMSSDPWVRTLPNCFLATCCEFGYSVCGGVFSFPAARELGHTMLKAAVRAAQHSN